MGDAICQVCQEEWGINMVGTGQLGKAAIKDKEIKKGTHKPLLYQQNTKPLLHAVWAFNNFVKTLSNLHSHYYCCRRNKEMSKRSSYQKKSKGTN
jgi:hypothetical protein